MMVWVAAMILQEILRSIPETMTVLQSLGIVRIMSFTLVVERARLTLQ